MIKHFIFGFCLALALTASAMAQATSGPAVNGAIPVVNSVERADAATAAAHSHTSAATITISPGPAGSLTQSVYITGIDISNCQNAAVTAAAPTYITTTGFNGSPQYQVGSGPATAGLCSPSVINFTAPLKSQTPGTNVTFVLPTFITNQTVSVN